MTGSSRAISSAGQAPYKVLTSSVAGRPARFLRGYVVDVLVVEVRFVHRRQCPVTTSSLLVCPAIWHSSKVAAQAHGTSWSVPSSKCGRGRRTHSRVRWRRNRARRGVRPYEVLHSGRDVVGR